MRWAGAVLVAVLLAGCGGAADGEPAAGGTPSGGGPGTGTGSSGTGSPATGSGGTAGKPTAAAAPTPKRKHAGARTTTVGSVTIVEPTGPTPATAPVVLFTQGTDPAAYQRWIDHLAGSGAIVVFQNVSTDETAAEGVRTAVRTLARSRTKPRWDRLTLVGHSIGGVLSTRLAAAAAAEKLPKPVAVLAVEPPAPEAPLSRLPQGIRVVVVAGDRDDRVQDGPRQLWNGLAGVPAADKDYVLVRSDDRGEPPAVADHLFPLSSVLDPLDRALWGLLDAVRAGRPLEPDVGTWSDGTAITPMLITDNPR